MRCRPRSLPGVRPRPNKRVTERALLVWVTKLVGASAMSSVLRVGLQDLLGFDLFDPRAEARRTDGWQARGRDYRVACPPQSMALNPDDAGTAGMEPGCAPTIFPGSMPAVPA